MLRRLPQKRLLSSTSTVQVIVGLEIHAQLAVSSKLFAPLVKPFHPFDVAVPGTLPVLSQSAVRSAVLAAAALNCRVQTISRFERKHYYYADLPHGYQITQQRWPLATSGHLQVNDSNISCRINRIQLEMDTGKSTINGLNTRVDFARAGMPLIEIVTEPDLRSSREAVEVVTEIRKILQHAKACDGRMELGNLRVDVNVNIVKKDKHKTPRVEVKNLNSLQQVHDCIEYEVKRQQTIDYDYAETRTWNPLKRCTELLRIKDTEQDYRFLPEPDLPPLVLCEYVLGTNTVEEFVRENLAELPSAAYKRLVETYNLTDAQASVLTNDPPAIAYFDEAVKNFASSKEGTKFLANFICNELIAVIKKAEGVEQASVANSKVSPQQISEIVQLVVDSKLSKTAAKNLLEIVYADDKELRVSPTKIAKERGLSLITDAVQLRNFCKAVIDAHPEKMEVYRRGGKFVRKIQKLFIGKAMAESENQAQPERLREILFECMEETANNNKSENKSNR